MPALISGMVATVNTTADLASVFRFLGRYYDNRFSRAALLLEGAVMPGIALGFAVPVALTALTLFRPARTIH